MMVKRGFLPVFFLLFLIASPLAQVQGLTASHPEVGAIYYVWYDLAKLVSWEYPKVQDKPVIGYYNSCDADVIRQHFAWLSDLHVDFIVVSWWGMYNNSEIYDPEWLSFQHNATMQIFQVAKENVTNVKVALMVEPFNENETYACTYNYAEIYDWVYTNLYQQYPTIYYKVDGKPLMCFFNAVNMTAPNVFQRDDRFTVKIVGNDPTAEWIYNPLQEYVEPLIRDRQVAVIPRFDDFYVRPNNMTVDAELEYLYAEQWEYALNMTRQGAVDFVTITSWNEFPERSMIEPHYDSTAWNTDPYYLYNMTKEYIAELKGIQIAASAVTPQFWYQNPWVFGSVAGVVLLAVFVAVKIYEHS